MAIRSLFGVAPDPSKTNVFAGLAQGLKYNPQQVAQGRLINGQVDLNEASVLEKQAQTGKVDEETRGVRFKNEGIKQVAMNLASPNSYVNAPDGTLGINQNSAPAIFAAHVASGGKPEDFSSLVNGYAMRAQKQAWDVETANNAHSNSMAADQAKRDQTPVVVRPGESLFDPRDILHRTGEPTPPPPSAPPQNQGPPLQEINSLGNSVQGLAKMFAGNLEVRPAIATGNSAPVGSMTPLGHAVAGNPPAAGAIAGAGMPMPQGMTPQPSGPVIAQITDYGQRDDIYGDSLTRAGSNAIGGRLSAQSVALSPDMERMALANGVKIGQPVNIQLSDGRVVQRIFNDRTMQDEQATQKFGRPLTGRVDLYHPANGPDPLRGASVTSISPATQQPTPASPATPASPVPIVSIPPLAGKDDKNQITKKDWLAKGHALDEAINTLQRVDFSGGESWIAGTPFIGPAFDKIQQAIGNEGAAARVSRKEVALAVVMKAMEALGGRKTQAEVALFMGVIPAEGAAASIWKNWAAGRIAKLQTEKKNLNSDYKALNLSDATSGAVGPSVEDKAPSKLKLEAQAVAAQYPHNAAEAAKRLKAATGEDL